MSYELFTKLATEVFGDAKMEVYYQTWKLSKTPSLSGASLARSDTYADHEYGGGSKGCSLARSDTYADHEYGQGSTSSQNLFAKYCYTPPQSMVTHTPIAPKKKTANKPTDDDAMQGIAKQLFP